MMCEVFHATLFRLLQVFIGSSLDIDLNIDCLDIDHWPSVIFHSAGQWI